MQNTKRIGIMENAEPFVSVVVPVYNVAPYLDKCVNTLRFQTYHKYEVILVDDGSTDESGKMCDGYAKEDKKIRVFHKKNGGVSDARNYGVRQALGEFIIFVDPDDYVSEDYVSYLVGLKRRMKCDIAVARSVYGIDNQYIFNAEVKKEICMRREKALSVMLYGNLFGVSPWGKIFPKKFVLSYPFPKGIIYEDLATIYKIVEQCRCVAYGEKEIYYYRRREGSIRLQKVTEKHLYGLTIAKNVLKDMEQRHPIAVSAARYRCARIITEFIPYLLSGMPEERLIYKQLREELKPFFKTTIKDGEVSLLIKARCIAIMLGYFPTVCFWTTTMKIRKLFLEKK